MADGPYDWAADKGWPGAQENEATKAARVLDTHFPEDAPKGHWDPDADDA